MGKEKKSDEPPDLGIKTSRYFTRTCSNCGAEIAYFFTICPNCKTAWDEKKKEEPSTKVKRKNVKIVVKITEEDFKEPIENIYLIFSADRGKTWYKLKMENAVDYYISEIPDVPNKAIIIYYIEVYLENGNKIIENNEGQYFYYKVGKIDEQKVSEPTKKEAREIKRNVDQSKEEPKTYYTPEEKTASSEQKNTIQEPIIFDNQESLEEIDPKELEQEIPEYREEIDTAKKKTKEDLTIFGKPQTERDPDLKVCPHCNSKIKEHWSTCPICGKKL
jgi:RNA polymerase subunit RPABC4/transcription elongation factor Spt4